MSEDTVPLTTFLELGEGYEAIAKLAGEETGHRKRAEKESKQLQRALADLRAINAGLCEALKDAEPWLMRLTSEVIDGEGVRTEYAAICAQVRAAIAKATDSQ